MPGPSILSPRNVIGRILARLDIDDGSGWIGDVSMPTNSDQASETYAWLGASPAMREWIGGRQPKALSANPITIKNRLFEATMEVDVADLRRDKTGQLDIRIGELTGRANGHWASLLSTLIAAGGTTLCYDGDYFFGAAHAEGSSGTQVNLLTSSQVAALDVTTAAAPTEAEMAAAIMGVIGYMMTYKDDRGEPMNENARLWHVMCPYNLYGMALAVASKLVLIGASGVAQDNIIKKSAFQLRVSMNPRLTTTTVFYMFRGDASAKPFIRQSEYAPKVAAVAAGSELEFNNHVHHYGIEASRNVGVAYWQYGAHCTLS